MPPEVVNQFNRRVCPGFPPVPEGHCGTGSEYVSSTLATSISTVARMTIHGQKHAHCLLSREYPRFASYSHYTAMVIPRTALSARSTRITTRRTSPCAYFRDHGGSHSSEFNKLSQFRRPWVSIFAHISMITEHLLHEQAHQALTFPRPCGQRSIPSGFLSFSFYAYFHDHGASLTRASSPSSHISQTMWATVDPLGFS